MKAWISARILTLALCFYALQAVAEEIYSG